jgi:site-specific DNA-methyltransferase (adenine-specific)
MSDRIALHHADCVEWLRALAVQIEAGEAEPFDGCATDPPYEIGFMGKSWDSSGVAFQPETWRAVFDCLKPGAHLAAFASTRTYHRIACAIEDAGFEIRDQLAWAYGSGFPKSLNVSKAIDKAAGAEREVVGAGKWAGRESSTDFGLVNDDAWQGGADRKETAPATPEAAQWAGWGTALKPAWEPICLARKPLIGTVAANVLAHGTGAINIDACRIEGADAEEGRTRHGGGIPGNGSSYELPDYQAPMPAGRFPANLLHDGSEQVLAWFPDTQSGQLLPTHDAKESTNGSMSGKNYAGRITGEFGGDSGSAARFFYSAKAGPLDRIGSEHATIKPVDLMRWLCRLLTPPGGRLLDPFAGSGTTGIACIAESFDCTMIELDAAHVADIERKLAFLRGKGGMRTVEQHRKRRDLGKLKDDPGPLFGG